MLEHSAAGGRDNKIKINMFRNKNFKTKPESPELDDAQMKDLRDHLGSLSTEELENRLDQTRQDALRDHGPFPEGTTPGNVNRTVSTIQEILDKRSEDRNSESKA